MKDNENKIIDGVIVYKDSGCMDSVGVYFSGSSEEFDKAYDEDPYEYRNVKYVGYHVTREDLERLANLKSREIQISYTPNNYEQNCIDLDEVMEERKAILSKYPEEYEIVYGESLKTSTSFNK